MKKVAVWILLAIISISIVNADDGGVRFPEDWTYGNIYVTEENPHVALEKELLVVEQIPLQYGNPGLVEAVFLFNNTSNETVNVPCAFPVVVTMPYTCIAGTAKPLIAFNDDPNHALWHLALGKKNAPINDHDQTYPLADITALDKKLRVMSYADYMNDLRLYGDSTAKNFTDLTCTIIQDDKDIAVKMVGIETSISDSNTKTEDGMPILQVTMVIHFYHELSFAPNEHSVLSVRYPIDTITYSFRRTEYKLTYDISTGGTWKGSMDSFVILTDSEMTVSGNAETSFEKTTLDYFTFDGNKTRLYAIQNYKPKPEESLTFTAEYYSFEAYYGTPPAQREKQDFVTDISASSFLAGSYLMSSNTDGKSENSNTELFRSTYKPETSFDGSVYNGWVEGAKGNGEGEWISFTLTKSALGPFAANGLTRFSIYDYDFIYKNKINGDTYSSWFDNNRIASMTLRNLDTDAKTALRFKDIYPFHIHEYIPDGWFSVNAVENPCFLAPGNYQMIIESSYKGDRYDDTVLGEVWFYPLGDTLAEILSDDASSRYTLYHKPLNACIERYIAQWHKLRKDSEHDLDK